MSISPTASAPIVYIAAIRDMIQSLYGAGMRHDEQELLQFYRRLAEFNDAGPVKIVGVEGHGGALPQYDAMKSRLSLKISERITKALGKTIFQRPLIRGPFGVNTRALHFDDLKWTLEQMAIAGGANQGHKVVFKLFEAQNRPEEYIASLKIIQAMRNAGMNVGVEVSMVISDKPGLNDAHYKGVAQSLLSPELFARHGIDPTIVAGFSLKDMIGGVKSSADAEGSTINARNLTMIAMDAMQKFAAATDHHGMYMGWHTHEIGNAHNCLLEASQTFAAHRARFGVITEFQQDVTAPNLGFADLQKLTDAYAEQGLGEGMNAAQKKIWGDMVGYLNSAAERLQKLRIDVSKWDKSLLEYGQLASGGLPYVEEHGIEQFRKHVAKMLDSNAGPESMERAGKILRCVFASINGVIDNDMGNAHSVTPAMKFINDLTVDVMTRYLNTPEFTALIASEASNKSIDEAFSKPIKDTAFMASVRTQYHHFSSRPMVIQAVDYFCTPLPTPVSQEHLQLLRAKLFNHYFPTDYKQLAKVDATNTASMLKHLSEADYGRVRAQLAGQLLDKVAAKQTLLDAGVPEKTADHFVARSIGVNSLPINDGVRPLLQTKVLPAVLKFIEATGGKLIRRLGLEPKDDTETHAGFAAMLLRPSQGRDLAGPVATMLQGIFTKRKGWNGAAMNSGYPANGNGHSNGNGSNGNGNGSHGTVDSSPSRPPGVKGKSAHAATIANSAAVTAGADGPPVAQHG